MAYVNPISFFTFTVLRVSIPDLSNSCTVTSIAGKKELTVSDSDRLSILTFPGVYVTGDKSIKKEEKPGAAPFVSLLQLQLLPGDQFSLVDTP